VDQETMLHHLEELAERLGITVRYESAAGRVGLCMLRGKRVAVVDANLRVAERVAALSSVLADEELNGVYIPPEVRRRLERSSPLRVRPGDVEEGSEVLEAPPPEGNETPSTDPESGPEAGPGEDPEDHGQKETASEQSSAGPEADAG